MKKTEAGSTETTKKRGKENGYKSTTLWAKRKRKGIEADQRQAKYDGLTLAQRVKLVKSRSGSAKELARLKSIQKAEKDAKKAITEPSGH